MRQDYFLYKDTKASRAREGAYRRAEEGLVELSSPPFRLACHTTSELCCIMALRAGSMLSSKTWNGLSTGELFRVQMSQVPAQHTTSLKCLQVRHVPSIFAVGSQIGES